MFPSKGLEGTSDIMVTLKFGVDPSYPSSLLHIRISPVLGAGRPQGIAVDSFETPKL